MTNSSSSATAVASTAGETIEAEPDEAAAQVTEAIGACVNAGDAYVGEAGTTASIESKSDGEAVHVIDVGVDAVHAETKLRVEGTSAFSAGG